MQGGLDRANGLLGGGVGACEGAERNAFGVGVGGEDLAVGDGCGDEAHGDMGIGGAVAVVFAGDGEVEGVAVKCLAVDLEWVGGEHGSVYLG